MKRKVKMAIQAPSSVYPLLASNIEYTADQLSPIRLCRMAISRRASMPGILSRQRLSTPSKAWGTTWMCGRIFPDRMAVCAQ